MIVLTNKPEKYGWVPRENLWPAAALDMNPERLVAKYPTARIRSVHDLTGTASGPCLILGCGPSSKLLDRKLDVPVFTINRAIRGYPWARYWVIHDVCLLGELEGMVPKGVDLICQAAFTYTWEAWRDYFGEVFIANMARIPARYLLPKKPLYWNQTTFGWLLHLCIRMGYDPIFILGVDSVGGGYVNPQFSPEEVLRNHAGVRERTLEMFQPMLKAGWYERPVRIVDLSPTGYLPVEKGSLADVH